MKKAICTCLILLAACTPPKDQLLNNSDLQQGKTLQVVTSQPMPFSLMTGGTAGSWGLLGPIFGNIAAQSSAQSNGSALIKANNIQNPSYLVADSLSKSMQQSYKMLPATETPVVLQTSDTATISQMYGKSDYLLTISNNWGTAHNLAGSLAVYNNMTMELKNNLTGKVVATSYCYEKTDHDYGLDELRDNGAAKLKEAIAAATNKCNAQFKTALGINS